MNYPMSSFFDNNYFRMHFYTNMREWTSITVDMDVVVVEAYGDWDDGTDQAKVYNITNKNFPPLTFMQIIFESDDIDFES